MKQLAWRMVLAASTLAACGGGGSDSGSGSVDEWCTIAQQIADLEATNPNVLDVERADSIALDEYRRLLDEAAIVAPEEVLADANAMADGVDQFVNVAESVSFDFDTLDDTELLGAVGDLLALEEPIDRIRAYNERQCGVSDAAAVGADDDRAAEATTTATTGIVASPTGEVDAGDFDPTAGSIREQAIAVFVELGFSEQEAACIFDNVDFTDPDLVDDSAALAEVLTLCGIDFERLNELGVN